jgi:iron-regulated transporter 1
VQHTSSSWGYRSAEFAFPLYFAYLFPGTLLPASIYGLSLLVASLFLSPSVGRYVDKHKTKRLAVVRSFIVAQKLSVACSYGGFCFLFNLGETAIPVGQRWAAFVALTFVGILVVLSGTAMTIAVERDWVTTIAKGEETKLTKLNTIM